MPAGIPPGVLPGDVLKIPVPVPIDVRGNTIDIVGLLNPDFGNTRPNGRHRTVDAAGRADFPGGESALHAVRAAYLVRVVAFPDIPRPGDIETEPERRIDKVPR
ncbi:chaplin [Streptomyces sp. NPDC058751]|uniref:chaplin n=1 Tax=Streptomyces sp. NPDC058751 TaxID=3346623 RepID=UPI0036B8055F